MQSFELELPDSAKIANVALVTSDGNVETLLLKISDCSGKRVTFNGNVSINPYVRGVYSVADRLPGRHDFVIAYDCDHRKAYVCIYSGFNFMDWNTDKVIDNVTHWKYIYLPKEW